MVKNEEDIILNLIYLLFEFNDRHCIPYILLDFFVLFVLGDAFLSVLCVVWLVIVVSCVTLL